MLPWLGAGGLVVGMLVVFLVVYSLWKPAGQTAFQMDANEVLTHLVGPWSVEFETSGPNPKTVRGVIRHEWVANEKFLRAYSNTDDGRESLIMYRYDPDAKTFRRWSFARWAFGAVPGPVVYEGPGTGEWDMKGSTLAWRAELPLSHKVLHEDRWLDSDNFEWKTEVRNHVGAVVLRQTKKMHRLTTNEAVGPKLPPDPMRARELAVLERMLGKWTTNNDVTLAEMKDLKVKSQSVQETTPILANVFFETRERTQPGDREDYLITGYDENRKIYRFWHFGADGAITEADGTWNQEENKLTWKSTDGRLTGVWNLADPNEHHASMAAKDPQGRRLYEVDAVARRAGAVVKPPTLVYERGILDYAEIHDADEKRFDAWIAQMKADGYRPVSLNVQTVKETPRYTCVALKEEAKKVWEFARVRSDDAKHIEEMRNKDYVAIAQCVYREKGHLYQAYLWVLDKNASMDWPLLGSKEDIDKKIAEARKRKTRPVYRSAFQGAAIVYDIIIGGPTNVAWSDLVDQSLNDCKTWIEKQKAQGWRPEHLYAYGAGPNTRFGAITIQDPKGPDWEISWAMTPAQYGAELAARKRHGFRPHTAVGHDDDSGALCLSVIWIRYFDPAAKAAPMPP